MAQEVTEITETDAIVEKYGSDKSCLIQIMLEIQRRSVGSRRTICEQ